MQITGSDTKMQIPGWNMHGAVCDEGLAKLIIFMNYLLNWLCNSLLAW